MKKVRIQYPREKNNPLLDGRIHEVEVDSMDIIDINGQTFYQLSYSDMTAGGVPMLTFLTEVNGVICKVPLSKYDYKRINEVLSGCPRKTATEEEISSLLPNYIGLAATVSIEDIANSKTILSRNVTIQYPYSPINEGIDGNVHQITPTRLIRLNVNGFDLYFMRYYDYNLGHEMVTILIRIDGALYKVPLTSYNINELEDFVQRYGVSELEPYSLFAGAALPTDKPTIGLAATMSLRDIINIKTKENKNVVEYPYYIPYNMDNAMSISNRVFRSNCRIYENGMEDFLFEKEKNGNIIENAIRNGIRENMDKIERGESFFFDIEVEIPSGTTVAMPTKDGREVLALYIPGIHKRRVFMSPNMIEEYEKPTKLCERIGIRTFNEDYGGYEDNPIVFRDGYKGLLPITFLGLPKEYKDANTFYIPQRHVERKPIEKEHNEIFNRPEVLRLRDFYINTLTDVYSICDGVGINSNYIEEYKETIRIMLVRELKELNYNDNDIRRIINFVDNEFIKQKYNTKRGL